MDEFKETESHIISAAAFVEGGVQEACDDACSICLEVTSCKHDFHLQCILEWCQRSSNCPMCWESISLKDPTSQELLNAVEQERNIRLIPSRNTSIFRHPTLGDFELQHLPMGMNDPDLEDRIIQHLAAGAAIGRTQHIGWGADYRNQSPVHARTQFVGNESQENVSSCVQSNLISASSSGSAVAPFTHTGICSDRSFMGRPSLQTQDRAGPSEFQSFSDSWKSRLNAISIKYKESISKNTRGWKEKLFSKGSPMPDIGSEVRREPNTGIATVTRMMEHLETRNNNRAGCALQSNNPRNPSDSQQSNPDNRNAINRTSSNGDTCAAIATSSMSL
ncbi:hypothetical protein F511_03214 [Dorcoceras hygrometricum]|uniref:RING-type E3 ubiquitin transferase n=1 Tax=Dorcoceras hygrometricum TaxID=472368 RepID=A0A2Z7B256_9LAMI|nr:hypothetical protein F511_03214 [Dorcoceras hygrometricum]